MLTVSKAKSTRLLPIPCACCTTQIYKNLYKNWIFRKFKYARKEEFYAQLFVSVNLLDLVPEDNFTENCKPNSIYISFTKLLKSIMVRKDRESIDPVVFFKDIVGGIFE